MPISRRSFVVSAGATLAAVVGSPRLVLPWRRRYALVIRGGTVFDGSGAAGIVADVAIENGRIAAIGKNLEDQGAVVIDAHGMAVAPGFIDIHSHGDGSLWSDPRAESIVRQGVTTIVVGQDGSSRAPTGGAEGDGDSGRAFPGFAAFFQALQTLQPSVNVASMVGLGTVRGIVIGNVDRPATETEIARMTQLVEQALAEGACGASSGLEYTPGAFATREELIALCKPLASRRLPYATHMRNEDDHVLEAIDESIAVATGAGCPLQISHLKTEGPRNWGKLDEIFAHIHRARGGLDVAAKPNEAARKQAPSKKRGAAASRTKRAAAAPAAAPTPAGIDVAFDRYPYIAYQTGLSNLFPVWSRAGSTEEFLKRIDDPSTAEKIRRETMAKVELIGGWDNVQISGISNYADAAADGKRIGSFAKTQQLEPYALAVALLQRGKGNVGMVGFAMSEDNLARILAHPQGMVCSDGGAYATDGPTHKGHPHPRGLGTFPRVLGRYVREKKALSLASAIHKMSGFPASRIGLTDRGRLAPGMAADVVVFDPSTVDDKATFEDPFHYPVGIKVVVVNGVVALRDDQRSTDRAGQGLAAKG